MYINECDFGIPYHFELVKFLTCIAYLNLPRVVGVQVPLVLAGLIGVDVNTEVSVVVGGIGTSDPVIGIAVV